MSDSWQQIHKNKLKNSITLGDSSNDDDDGDSDSGSDTAMDTTTIMNRISHTISSTKTTLYRFSMELLKYTPLTVYFLQENQAWNKIRCHCSSSMEGWMTLYGRKIDTDTIEQYTNTNYTPKSYTKHVNIINGSSYHHYLIQQYLVKLYFSKEENMHPCIANPESMSIAVSSHIHTLININCVDRHISSNWVNNGSTSSDRSKTHTSPVLFSDNNSQSACASSYQSSWSTATATNTSLSMHPNSNHRISTIFYCPVKWMWYLKFQIFIMSHHLYHLWRSYNCLRWTYMQKFCHNNMVEN